MKESKPESVPEELVDYVATAINLDEIQAVGGRFQYPDGLTPVEWMTLRALARGRGKAEKLKPKPK